MNEIKSEYLEICPIDRNRAEINEILKYKECKKDYYFLKDSFDNLLKSGNCKNLKESKKLCEVENKLKAFELFFKEITGFFPFSLQKYWAKRVLNGESFSIIAPTGFGKSTFGIIFSLFLIDALKAKKIYYIVPTKILLREIEYKFLKFSEKLSHIKILTIKKTKDKEKLSEDFDILISTSQFLHKNFHLLPKGFKFLYIDDADSMIRQPKNIDKVLNLIGFSNEDIEKALKIIDLKRSGNFEEAEQIRATIDTTNKGQIIVASATLAPKTKRINIFRELLNFEIGLSSTYLRNVEDLYIELPEKSIEDLLKISIKWIKKLGYGGFIFLSDDVSKEMLYQYKEILNNEGIKAITYEEFNSKNRELFERKQIQVVVGFSNIRNPLTRGIDLPHIVRYSIFIGVPKFKLSLKLNYSPRALFNLFLSLKDYIRNYYENDFQFTKDLIFLRKYSFLKEEQILENKNLKNKIEVIKQKLEQILTDREMIEKIKKDPKLSIIEENNNLFLLISDPRGYIQASGRTSRLYPLGLTKGLSLLLVENHKVFEHLKTKLRLLGYKINFKELDKNYFLEKLIKEIDEDREVVKKFMVGEIEEFEDPVKTCLIIVESPTKAKTIANFFGKPSRRSYQNYWVYEISIGNYIVNIIATLGHFVDLVHQEGFYGVKRYNNYFIPVFEPLKICKKCNRHVSIKKDKCEICGSSSFLDKRILIEFLRKLANEVNEIYIATDPDTEGEKIAFDLYIYLYPYNTNIKRMEMHEITKEEFLKRFNETRDINKSLVCAQLTRRISDRWIGFSLSEELQEHFKNLNLSAGRVQTPVLGWIILNDELRKKEKYYLGRFYYDENNFIEFNFEDRELAKKIRENKKNLKLETIILEKREENINPPPPFQTSDLLKSAWELLKLDAVTTMNLAQDLFERGLITYHRTDSYYVSDFGRNLAKEFLEKQLKKDLIYIRAWGAPGTHECIRPTKPFTVDDIIEQAILRQEQILSRNHLRLYNLILNRFIASQCKPAKIEKNLVKITLKIDNIPIIEETKEFIYKIKNRGFDEFLNTLKVIPLENKVYDVINFKLIRLPKFIPYTNATIIEEMKNRGLGRPSTYSNIIQTLFERKYVILNKGYLIPTKHGKIIYEYLKEKYPDLISENFTKQLEEAMDKIELNEIDYQSVLENLFIRVFGII